MPMNTSLDSSIAEVSNVFCRDTDAWDESIAHRKQDKWPKRWGKTVLSSPLWIPIRVDGLFNKMIIFCTDSGKLTSTLRKFIPRLKKRFTRSTWNKALPSRSSARLESANFTRSTLHHPRVRCSSRFMVMVRPSAVEAIVNVHIRSTRL